MPTIGGEINIVNLTKYNWTLLSKSDGGGYQIDVGGILNKKVIQSGMLYYKLTQFEINIQS